MDDATQDTEQLDRQLTVLLEQIETTTTSLAERISDDSPGLTYADLTDPEPAADEESEQDDAEAEDAADDELESAVEEMLQQAVDETGAATSEEAQALDDELARLGDDMLASDDGLPPAGDIEAPASTEPEAESADEPVAEAPEQDEEPTLDEPTLVDDAEPAPPPAEPVADDGVPAGDLEAPAPQPEAQPEPEPVHAAPEPAPDPEPAPVVTKVREPLPAEPWPKALAIARLIFATIVAAGASLWTWLRAMAPVVKQKAGPQAMRVMAKMSRPLAGQPPMIKSAIGWVAIVTTFWAVIVILYMVAIRDPSPPTPTKPAVDLIEPGSDV